MGQHIVGHRHQRVLLDKELTVLHHDGQAVYIGVNDKAHIGKALTHEITDSRQVLRYWLGRVAKVARRVTEKFFHLIHAQCLEQHGYGNAAHRVHGIHSHREPCTLDGINVDQRQGQHRVDVPAQVGVVFLLASQMIHIGAVEIFGFGKPEHLLALGVGQELAVVIEQLQRIPLLGVVRGSDDDAATGFLAHYSQFGGRRCGQPDVDNVEAHAREGAHHQVEHHPARHTGVAAHHDNIRADRAVTPHKGGIGRSEFHNVERRQSVACAAPDGAANSRNRFNQ